MNGKLMDSYFELLDGNITYDSAIIKVYKEDAPSSTNTHYVLLRAEGLTDSSNNDRFEFQSIVVVDVVTVHKTNVNRSIADNISDQIFNLIFPVKNVNNLPVQSGIQILNVKLDTSTYLYEDDDVSKYYRHVMRFFNYLIKR